MKTRSDALCKVTKFTAVCQHLCDIGQVTKMSQLQIIGQGYGHVRRVFRVNVAKIPIVIRGFRIVAVLHIRKFFSCPVSEAVSRMFCRGRIGGHHCLDQNDISLWLILSDPTSPEALDDDSQPLPTLLGWSSKQNMQVRDAGQQRPGRFGKARPRIKQDPVWIQLIANGSEHRAQRIVLAIARRIATAIAWWFQIHSGKFARIGRIEAACGKDKDLSCPDDLRSPARMPEIKALLLP